MKQKRVLFLLVNYFNDNEVVEFITTILSKQRNVLYDVIITDNGSEDVTILNQLTFINHSVQIITPPENIGYLNGAKLGFDFYCKSNPVPDFTIVCNTDIKFEDDFFLDKLINESSHKNADVIGPTIISTLTSHHQNPMYKERIPIKKIKRLLWIYRYYPIYVIYQLGAYLKRFIEKRAPENKKQSSEFVYAVHGSFLIFARSFFDKGNTFKFPSFLYAEELFIAEQCIKNKSNIFYNSNLTVFHSEHSTSGFIKNRKHVNWLKQSLNCIYLHYYR
jgi:GT2 family glycosyltransferase